MHSARVISVNRGRRPDLLVGGKPAGPGSTSGRRPGRSGSASAGLDGDEYGDKENHGGVEQAVYAYAREDLDWWTEQLGRELRNGIFGENITTAGLDVTGALIGETWLLGTAVVQVTAPRIPCVTFKSWLDEQHWVKRFAQGRRPGAYLRVLTEGTVAAGDERACSTGRRAVLPWPSRCGPIYGDREIMRRLLEVEGRGRKWDEIGRNVLSRAGV